MCNGTFNASEPLYSSWEWILHQCSTCLFAIVEVYMLVCLLLNEVRTSFGQQNAASAEVQSDSSGNKRATFPVKPKKTERKRKRRFACISWFTIAACCCAIFKTLSNEIDLFWGTKSNQACKLVGIFVMCGYGGVVCFCMLVLWLRQDAVQNNRALSNLPAKRLRIYGSKVLLVLMLVVFTCLLVLNTVGLQLKPSPKGCCFDDMGSVAQSARASSGLVFTLLFQPIFAALLLYPLLKKLPADCGGKMTGVRRVKELTKRTFISLCAIAVSDAGAILASFLLAHEPAIWVSTAYDLNSFLGVASLVFVYSDWRQRMRLTCCARAPKQAVAALVTNVGPRSLGAN